LQLWRACFLGQYPLVALLHQLLNPKLTPVNMRSPTKQLSIMEILTFGSGFPFETGAHIQQVKKKRFTMVFPKPTAVRKPCLTGL